MEIVLQVIAENIIASAHNRSFDGVTFHYYVLMFKTE